MKKLLAYYLSASMRMKKLLWRIMHRILINKYKGSEVVFLNYGFEYLDPHKEPLELMEMDEKERYCIQLYHSTVEGVDLQNKDILEVGCGRGGGASYITRYFNPNSYIGLDLSKEVVKFNNNFHKLKRLSFVAANAQKLPFNSHSFDTVVNVESSRSYNDIDAFISEAYRVLRPKGHLLFADMRTEEENEILRERFRKAGFEIIKEANIVQNVVKALELDSERRCKLMKERIPKMFHGFAEEFSSTEGSQRFKEFADGTMSYMQYILQKE